ncbi:soluble quino protein glucose dehydrogenase [Patellaria atrata CBS 101060]|uniref:Soluble quino protein glucose dehydrogenase n=1 Tax=Patellaria atrata CBS 101060 TaxID=1346257 RepID=A0A9P4VWB6_9PEZI|nr:soluble quino protein glucose dehydrogenase [Patellaria atrata CBS 101060]
MGLDYKLLLLSIQIVLPNLQVVAAQSACSTTLTPDYPAPSLASGYRAQLVANGLSSPRAITFDKNGNLLVIDQGKGVIAFSFDGDGTCLSDRRTVVNDGSLNHGLQVSNDGKTLYASTSESVSAWNYDAEAREVRGDQRILVENMSNNGGHISRTLLLSKKVNGTLVVSRGSEGNFDLQTLDVTSGHSQIKAFDLTDDTNLPYDYNNDGLLLGWGLRNSVGVAEHPQSGGIYSVENSIDEMEREGEDIHEDNPGEELNYHGTLQDNDFSGQGKNYGYPVCFAAWDVDSIPGNDDIHVGDQFAIGEQNSTVNDTICSEDRIAPRLTFEAHTAPLDLVFNEGGTEAWVSFHGSWNRDDPAGYYVGMIRFNEEGEPVEDSDSTSAAISIMANQGTSRCPDDCFRPVGLAFDSRGRLFMSSDRTGEIYAIIKDEDSQGTPTTSETPSGTETGGAAATTTGSASSMHGKQSGIAMLIALMIHVFFL